MRTVGNWIPRGSASLAMLATVCFWPVAAQSQAPAGKYGFLLNEYRMDSAGRTGGAGVGVVDIDGAGKVAGSVTFQGRDPVDPAANAGTFRFGGSYTAISEGVGILELDFEDGFRLLLATVTADHGQTLELMSPNFGSGNSVVRGSDQTLNGLLFVSRVIEGAGPTDAVPITVRRPNANSKVFTGGGSASGKMTCPDGSVGEWSVTVDNVTIALEGVHNNGPAAGNYLLAASTKFCGNEDWTTLSGLVTGSFAPAGSVLRLQNNGSVWSGTARAIQGRSLQGLYALHATTWPFPGGNEMILYFDGEGGVRGTVIFPVEREFGAMDWIGTYAVGDDGSGTINLKNADGQPGPSFSIVVVENGTAFLFIRTGANPQGGSVMFGQARSL